VAGVIGLADETTASVSQPVVFRGEYDLTNSSPRSAHTSITNVLYNARSCSCAGVTNSGTVGIEIGSYYNKDFSGDSVNTGMGLFQPTDQLLPTSRAHSQTVLAGFSYLIQYADCLTCPWTPLQTVTATGASTTVQDTFPNGRQRFYRVLCMGPATAP